VLSVIIGDINRERLAQVRSFGCETIDLTQSGELPDMIAQIVGEPVVDAAVDCVGFESTRLPRGCWRGFGYCFERRHRHTQVLLSFSQNAAAPALVA
jgi:threonine dehydrogenase-like Zn-dependent dehydrogenase